jgi:hypothetical protein
VIEELLKLVIEEVIGAGLSGAFRRARSRRARCLKLAAWICATGSLGLFIAAATLAIGNAVIFAAVGGAVSLAGFFGFGVWAAFVNAKCEFTGKS